MSKYTIDVRSICEMYYGEKEHVGQTKIDTILTTVAPKVFDFDFPIFDEDYRLVLEKKILRHFYTREIGMETEGLWKLKLEDKMNTVMPYFNKFYEMYVLKLNPLYNFSSTKLHGGAIDRTEDKKNDYENGAYSGTKATSNDTRLYSDTPQNGLTDVQEGKYLTNATIDTSENSASAMSGSAGNSVDKNVVSDMNGYYESVQGLQGKFVGEAWKAFRDGFMNVDELLFNELEELFMQLW